MFYGTPTPKKLTPHTSTVSSSVTRTPPIITDRVLWMPTSFSLEDIPIIRPSFLPFAELKMSPSRLRREPSSCSTSPCGATLRINELDIAIFRLQLKDGLGSRLFATQRNCPHMGQDLTDGSKVFVNDIEDLVIECPLHKLRFNMRNGALTSVGPATMQTLSLTTYPIRVNSLTDRVEIGFESLNPMMFSPDFD